MGRLTISTPSALLALAAPKTPTTTLFLMPELGKTILLTCAPIPQSSLSAQTPLFRTFAPNKWVQEVSSYSSPSSIPPSPSSSIQHTQPPPLTTPLSAISSPPSFSFITVTADDPSPLPKICLSPALADPPPRGAKKKKDVADVELVYILVVQGRSAGLRAKLVVCETLHGAGAEMLYEAGNGYSVVFSGVMLRGQVGMLRETGEGEWEVKKVEDVGVLGEMESGGMEVWGKVIGVVC